MKIRENGSTPKQKAYALRVWGAIGSNKRSIALDVGYSRFVASSAKSKIENTKGFQNALHALANESNNMALSVLSEFKARGLKGFSNKDLVGALNAIGSAWSRFNGGAQACNVFWQVGSSATFGTTTDFSGHVFAYQSITANTGATFHGQLLAREAAVTLDHNTITNDVCAGSPTHSPTPSASASSSATSTPSATATPTPVASTETGGKLPHTETSAFPLQVLGFGVVGLGLVGLVARRRRSFGASK